MDESMSVEAERDPRIELEQLRAMRALQREADETMEEALRARLSLEPLLGGLLPLLGRHLDASSAAVYTLDEDLAHRFYCWPQVGARVDERWMAALDEHRAGHALATRLLVHPLDVAGEDFGVVFAELAREPDPERRAFAQQLLAVWAEEVDDHLAVIAHARLKHRLTTGLSNALKDPVLDQGIDAAVALLRSEIAFDDLVLIFRHDDDSEVYYKVFSGGRLRYDSSDEAESAVRGLLQGRGVRLIAEGDAEVAHRLGMVRYQEELLINGVREQQVVGRLLVSKRSSDFSTFDRDLLARFADFLRQRIVDFNREYKRLATCFSPGQVSRLLRSPDYERRYLRPREEAVAVMFCDICGFTRICEQVLCEPAQIGRLVDTWAASAVAAIWESGGVFDKMVGDCVIGLWGPPFFDLTPQQCCSGALAAAQRIRDFTAGLAEQRELWPGGRLELPLGVSTGLNYTRLFVGLFGPDDDYTGFSSGMNATARLQGLAAQDEILAMESFVEALGRRELFGAARSAEVKNVAEPLRFAPLGGVVSSSPLQT